MKLLAASIYDKKACVYHPPFYSHNMKDAMRIFHRQLTTNEVFKNYEEDYQLYQVGHYDDRAGLLSPPEGGAPIFIIEATNLLGIKDEKDLQALD
jgi:hypothetical protein